jgi:hypothetical protein
MENIIETQKLIEIYESQTPLMANCSEHPNHTNDHCNIHANHTDTSHNNTTHINHNDV